MRMHVRDSNPDSRMTPGDRYRSRLPDRRHLCTLSSRHRVDPGRQIPLPGDFSDQAGFYSVNAEPLRKFLRVNDFKVIRGPKIEKG